MMTDPSLIRRLASSRFGQLIRFYQAAAINTLFGFGIYALMIRLGVNLYVAQIIAQVLGVTFNYFTYSRHVFRDRDASKGSFVLAYVGNYLVNLALLATLSRFIHSPYLAGFVATLGASVINYLALRSLVFRRRAPAR
jgi:putative flippase GtrA